MGQVNDVRSQIANGAAASHLLVQAPDFIFPIMGHDPLLEVYCPEVVNLPKSTRIDQLTDHAHRRHKTVVKSHHMLHTRFFYRLQHSLRFFGRAGKRFLAQDMFA